MNRSTACVFGLGLAMLLGCDNMADQPKQKVYAPQVGPANDAEQYRGVPGTAGSTAVRHPGAA